MTMSRLTEPPERHFSLLRPVGGGTPRLGKSCKGNPQGEGLVALASAPGRRAVSLRMISANELGEWARRMSSENSIFGVSNWRGG